MDLATRLHRDKHRRPRDTQAVDAAANNHAQWMLERDVNNMRDYYAQYVADLSKTQYAKEIWDLYMAGDLTPDIQLSGMAEEHAHSANVDSVMQEIKAAFEEEQRRQKYLSHD